METSQSDSKVAIANLRIAFGKGHLYALAAGAAERYLVTGAKKSFESLKERPSHSHRVRQMLRMLEAAFPSM